MECFDDSDKLMKTDKQTPESFWANTSGNDIIYRYKEASLGSGVVVLHSLQLGRLHAAVGARGGGRCVPRRGGFSRSCRCVVGSQTPAGRRAPRNGRRSRVRWVSTCSRWQWPMPRLHAAVTAFWAAILASDRASHRSGSRPGARRGNSPRRQRRRTTSAVGRKVEHQRARDEGWWSQVSANVSLTAWSVIPNGIEPLVPAVGAAQAASRMVSPLGNGPNHDFGVDRTVFIKLLDVMVRRDEPGAAPPL